MQALLSIIGLGLLGLDPVAAIIVASAIAVHSRKYKVLIFTLAFLLGTTVLGVFLSVLGQNAIDFIQSFIPSDISPLWLILNVLVIVVIIVWLTVRFTKRNKVKKEKKSKSLLGGAWQFFAMGLLFALSALTDPTFYAVIVIASETHNVFAMSGLHLLWISISQIPLLAIVVAYYLNAHNKLIVYSDKLWAAHKQKFTTILYILAILLALILLVDTIVYLTSGAYWF
jgi:hypothetical protein